MSSRLSRVATGLLGLGLMAGATGCNLFNGTSTGSSQMRVLLAAPDVSSVNVLIDNTVVSSNLGYGANTGYLTVNSGIRHLQVVATGSASAIVDESVTVPSSGEITVIVEGVTPNIVGLVLTDSNTAAAAGTAQLRLVNAAPGIASTDIYVVASGSALIAGQPTIAALAYGQTSTYEPLTFSTTTTTTQSYTTFFTQPGTTLLLVDSGPISFASGQNRTMVALNRQGTGTGFTFTLLPDLN